MPSPPECRLDHSSSLADRFLGGMAPVDDDPVVLRKPFRLHLTVDALPSEACWLRPVRQYSHFWRSARGLGPSGTSTRLKRVLPGTHYEPRGPLAWPAAISAPPYTLPFPGATWD
jgi:hypothetical protein